MHNITQWSQLLRREALGASARFIDSSSLIGEQGVLVGQNTETTRTLLAPLSVAQVPVRTPMPVAEPEHEMDSRDDRVVSSAALVLAIDRFLGDRRRDLIKTYDTTFEGLNARDKTALAGSWKIFGRVLAKQSLLQLSTDLDSLRRHARAVSSAEKPDEAAMAAWLNAEAVVGKDVADHQASLQRSEGAAWYAAMHGDLVALAALRRSIAETDQEVGNASQEIARQTGASRN